MNFVLVIYIVYMSTAYLKRYNPLGIKLVESKTKAFKCIYNTSQTLFLI